MQINHGSLQLPAVHCPISSCFTHRVFNIDLDTQHMGDFRVEEHSRQV